MELLILVIYKYINKGTLEELKFIDYDTANGECARNSL